MAEIQPLEKEAETPEEFVKEPRLTEEPKPEEKKPDEPKLVDHRALVEERERRREAERHVKEQERASAVMQGRVEAMERAFLARQEAAKEPPPDFDIDPVAAMKHSTESISGRLEKIEKAEQQAEQSRAVSEQLGRLQTIARTQRDSFIKENKDFDEAHAFVRESYDKELQTMGYADPMQRQAMLNQYEIAMGQQAIADQANMAQRIYDLAKVRGYKATAPVQDDKAGRIAAGQAAAKSLGSASGSGEPQITPKVVAAMSDAEFAEFNKNPENWKKLWK